MIFVKSCYVCSVCDVDVKVSCFESGVVKAVNVLTGENFTLCGIYKPPNTNISEFVDEFGTFCEFFLHDKSFTGTSLILGGDFNINLLRYGSNNIVSKFVDTVYASCLLPSIFLPTRGTKHSSTLIDNLFVNHSSLKLNGLIRFDISDHYPVFVTLPQLVQFDDAHNLNNSSHPVQFFRLLNKGAIDRLNFNLEKESWEFIISDSTVNDDYDKFISVIQIAVNKHVPIVKCNSKCPNITKVWMTAGLLKSIRKKGKLYKMAQTGKLSWESYKEYKNILNKLIKTRTQLYYSDIIIRHRKDARVMWQIINANINGGSKGNRDNFLSFNSANDLNDYFVNLGSNAVKNIKSQGSFKQYLNNRIVYRSYFTARNY